MQSVREEQGWFNYPPENEISAKPLQTVALIPVGLSLNTMSGYEAGHGKIYVHNEADVHSNTNQLRGWAGLRFEMQVSAQSH